MRSFSAFVQVFVCLSLSPGFLSGCSPQGAAEPGGHAVHASPTDRKAQPVRVRKDARMLTPQERADYVAAVLKLKQAPSPYTPGLSYYDQFVVWHRSLYVCDPSQPAGAMVMPHAGPLFLPWHRQYLLMFEDALRAVSGKQDLTVPYWDWTLPESTASVFQDDFMGGTGDPQQGHAVTTGPFRKGEWPITIQPESQSEQLSVWPYLVRNMGTPDTLPTAAEVQAALQLPLYDVAPYDTTSDWTLSLRNNLEGFRDAHGQPSMVCGADGRMMLLLTTAPTMHNFVHGWVGGVVGFSPELQRPVFGTMVLSTSPNDPVFFLHHANVDRIWAEWQRRHVHQTYQPLSGFPGNNVDDMMMPFHELGLMVTPADLEDVSRLGYRYQ